MPACTITCPRTLLVALALLALSAACGSQPFEITETPLDQAPTDEEFVKFESLGEGTLPSGARILLGTVVTDGPVTAESVRESVAFRGHRIGHCYAGTLDEHPGTVGDMVLAARIDREGLMRGVEAIYNSTGSRSLERCVTNAIEGMRFLESERRPATDVRLPLRFSPFFAPRQGPVLDPGATPPQT